MKDCPFQLNAKGYWQCPRKGCEWVYPIKSDKPPRRNCPQAPDRPKRDPKEVAFIEQLCKACDKRKRCLVCRSAQRHWENPFSQCPEYNW